MIIKCMRNISFGMALLQPFLVLAMIPFYLLKLISIEEIHILCSILLPVFSVFILVGCIFAVGIAFDNDFNKYK